MKNNKTGQQEDRKQMMLAEPMSRIIPRMAIPTIVAFLINSIYLRIVNYPF